LHCISCSCQHLATALHCCIPTMVFLVGKLWYVTALSRSWCEMLVTILLCLQGVSDTTVPGHLALFVWPQARRLGSMQCNVWLWRADPHSILCVAGWLHRHS
jgi:hypothetical protein